MPCHVLDTTVLSNFAHVRQPELVRLALGSTVYTTPVVMAELAEREKVGFVPACDWTWLQVVAPDEETMTLAKELQGVLDPGEGECLAVAIHRGCIFLSDDFAARRLARRRGVSVSGTLGVLIKLVKTKHLGQIEGDTLLQEMMAKGYRSPVSSLANLEEF